MYTEFLHIPYDREKNGQRWRINVIDRHFQANLTPIFFDPMIYYNHICHIFYLQKERHFSFT